LDPGNLTNVNGILFLSANDGTHGIQLWEAAPTAHFDVSASSSTVAGVPVNVTVTARDTLGNVDAWYTGTVAFNSSAGQAVLPATYPSPTAAAGLPPFSAGATLKTAGSQTVTATDTVTSSRTGSATVTVNPAAASTFVVTASPTTVTAGNSTSVTVTALDPFGNAATGYTGTVRFTSSDGQTALTAEETPSKKNGSFSGEPKNG